MNWNDFNDAQDQNIYELIPKGEILKVRMSIKPGGYSNEQKGWMGGYASRNPVSGSVYLSVEFVVLEGKYMRHKIWGTIGLHSEKSAEWENIGRAFIKCVLNSARGIGTGDTSAAAQDARRIKDFGDLDGIEFLGKIDIEKDQYGVSRNVIKHAITRGHKEYGARSPFAALAATALPQQMAPAAKLPSWVQNKKILD